MRSLLDLFKKKDIKGDMVPNRKPFADWTIGGREYVTKDKFPIKAQIASEGIVIYGWSLETRFKMNGEWSNWHRYHNNRIYYSMSSAIEAGIKIHPNGIKDIDWRICPLYKMNNAEYREFKIEQILSVNKKDTEVKSPLYEIKAWLLEEDFEIKFNNNSTIYKKGTFFIQRENGHVMISATPKTIVIRHKTQVFKEIQKLGKIKEVNIMDMKQIHPHLLKELKQKLNIKK